MDLLIVFVKDPRPGEVKTRLARTLGEAQALRVYRLLLEQTRDTVAAIPAEKAIFYGNALPESDLWSAAGYRRLPQQGAGLGERMQAAFEWGFTQGYSRIQLIGSDIAGLSAASLLQGFEALEDHDLVLGPARDGGYYLIGMKRAFPDVFRQIPWSTPEVLPLTLQATLRRSKSLYLLPECADIDTEADLKGTFLEGLFPDRKN